MKSVELVNENADAPAPPILLVVGIDNVDGVLEPKVLPNADTFVLATLNGEDDCSVVVSLPKIVGVIVAVVFVVIVLTLEIDNSGCMLGKAPGGLFSVFKLKENTLPSLGFTASEKS